ncbi:DUF4229 domain-containing protein [Rhodococcus sp. 06-412-2C]|uniref:DUF4229 domain-containing protein n=1 Tax=Nocardiaceae TaxID=85025 RepID=UPI0009B8FA9F|nr:MULTISPECIES: DUF4229 domain-containing protein [Rhodococcus]OZC90859.1 DUF4229 domain-containing protein [Rhodococcus sp. 06-412-2C]OZC97886.1 DUF4229 domain-containing protein [Rhodococcus sp. 06-412-2B]QII05137.1 DUF4229 domain-containing protein [Rhodococcus fascians A25f]
MPGEPGNLEAVSEATNADSSEPTSGNAVPGRSAKKSLAVNLGVYTFARLALVIVIAAVIVGVGLLFGVEVPVLVAAIFAVLISLPLSLLLFKKMRIRVNESIAAVDEDRRTARADLQSKLRGEDGKK